MLAVAILPAEQGKIRPWLPIRHKPDASHPALPVKNANLPKQMFYERLFDIILPIIAFGK